MKQGWMPALRRLAKLPVTMPLRFGFIRRRVGYELRPWFNELEVEIPLTHGMACPIGHWEAVHSFSEIFVTNEYGAFLEEMPLPARWVDLGCHAGYFTLYLAWKNAMAGKAGQWNALLVDADPRMAALTRWTLERNGLQQNGVFKLGLVGTGGTEADFALRPGMGSSKDLYSPADEICRVPCISGTEIEQMFPPPYDLIKIDIEGAEFDLLRNSAGMCRKAGHLLIEWHSPDRSGSREAELNALCSDAGFDLVREIRGRREVYVDGAWASSGVQLFRRR